MLNRFKSMFKVKGIITDVVMFFYSEVFNIFRRSFGCKYFVKVYTCPFFAKMIRCAYLRMC